MNLVNPELDDSWVGIERYLTTAYVKAQIPARHIGLESTEPGARLTIKRSDLEEHKKDLAQGILDGGDPGEHMRGLAQWLDQQVEGIVSGIPPRAFIET